MALDYFALTEGAKQIAPGDTLMAQQWLDDLAMTLKAGGLTANQRAYLYRLRTTWQRRARGEDSRWNEFGCAPGAKPQTRPVAALPARPVVVAPPRLATARPTAPTPVPAPPPPPVAPPVPAAPDPGVSSLLEKYGR